MEIKTFALSVIVIAISVLLANLNVYDLIAEAMKKEVDLAVCILSARNNAEFRDAVRNSWLTDIEKIKAEHGGTVMAKFVVGTTACPLPVDDRISPYGCEEWSPVLPEAKGGEVTSLAAFGTKPESSKTKTTLVTSVYFKVMHPIVLQRLGLIELLPLDQLAETERVHIVMYDAVSEEIVSRVQFSGSNKGRQENGYNYRSVQELVLPKGYEFVLEVEHSTDPDLDSSPISLDDTSRWSVGQQAGHAWSAQHLHHGMVHVEYLNPGLTKMAMFSETEYLPLASLMFRVNDISSLWQHVTDRCSRSQARGKEVELEHQRLKVEQATHGDVLLVDLMDIYSHLPDKVVLCHQWFAHNVKARHVVKTDDDCWLNLPAVYQRVKVMSGADTKFWWGNFRTGWSVDRHGKWREGHYTGLSYPSFACGSGSLVSRDIHRWLAGNQAVLVRYQGEDVAMAIWLSALKVKLLHDLGWRCDLSCRDLETLSLPQLTPDLITWFWNNSQHCPSPCQMC